MIREFRRETRTFTTDDAFGHPLENLEEMYSMSPEIFFSEERLLTMNVPKVTASRIANAIRNENGKVENNHKTMRAYLMSIPHEHPHSFDSYFLRMRGMGRVSAEHVFRILKIYGVYNVNLLVTEALRDLEVARQRVHDAVSNSADANVKDAWANFLKAEANHQQKLRE